MFTLLCRALRLSDTFMGVSRAVENGKTSFLALDFRKTGTSQISQKQIALRFSFRGPIRTHALKKSLTKTDVASLIQRSLDITQFENCTLLLSLVKSPMVHPTYLVARCNTIPFLVNLFQLFQAHLYGEKLYRVERVNPPPTRATLGEPTFYTFP